MILFKPMLSATVDDISSLRYPLLASPKLDGFRATVQGGVVLSRNLKPIPNPHVQALFGKKRYEGLDGELIVGQTTAPDCFRVTSSGVTSAEGKPAVRFHVFDQFGDKPFRSRLLAAGRLSDNLHVWHVTHLVIDDAATLASYQEHRLREGHEGVMLRDPNGLYKQGRATLREGSLMKLKIFEDAEAKVIAVEEAMHNTNEAVRNKLGHLERNSKKAGMVGKGVMGALRVVGINGRYKDVEFGIGSGFNDEDRKDVWKPGDIVKYKYFPLGSKDAPRFPVYLGRRSKLDM